MDQVININYLLWLLYYDTEIKDFLAPSNENEI